MDFYTSVIQDGKHILCRGVDKGLPVVTKEVYRPHLYMRGPQSGQWTNLAGEALHEFEFNDIWEAREFAKRYEGVKDSEVYGNQRWVYAWIADKFPGLINHDSSLIKIGTVDIEVDSTNGFPEPEDALEQITAITFHIDDLYHTFGTGDFKQKDPDFKGIYYKCKDEIDLIRNFLNVWCTNYPDIVTGWNCKMFDLPYLVNRIIKLLGRSSAALLSPWRKVEEEEINIGYKTAKVFKIFGIATIDYQDIYMKPSLNPNYGQESYKLDNIAKVELGRGKVDYSQYGTLPHEVMKANYQLFIEYNIDDVVLVVGLEKKLKLLELIMTLSYMTKTNFEDVFSQGRMWDAIIFNKLRDRNIAIPPQPKGKKETQYAGAYVKEPVPGMYHWLASFDLTSLYPHLIMMYNLSPETLVEPEDDETLHLLHNSGITVENLLHKRCDLAWLKDRNLTVTPNGQLFRTDIPGFLPEIMESMFAERAKHKKQELTYKTQTEQTKNETEKARLKVLAQREKAIQSALKICLNSAYGSIGNAYFRYFDIRIAEAVTLSGQLSIRWIQKAINEYFNKILGTTNNDYVLASDTDSVYLSFDVMTKKLLKDRSDPKLVIDVMDDICEKKIKPFIDKSYAQLSEYVNSRPGKMVMKREALVDRAIWCAKKNYMLSVWDNEGVKYEKPDIKITGWAAVRHDKPAICRKKLKESINVIMTSDEKTLRKFVNDFRVEFEKIPLDQIACPTGISELDMNPPRLNLRGEMYDLEFPHGAPMHVKAALTHNYYIHKFDLGKRYELIKPKSKIKYILLQEPNPLFTETVAFLDRLPTEFKAEKYIDYDAQFEKTFMSPLTMVLEAINWKIDASDDLMSFLT